MHNEAEVGWRLNHTCCWLKKGQMAEHLPPLSPQFSNLVELSRQLALNHKGFCSNSAVGKQQLSLLLQIARKVSYNTLLPTFNTHNLAVWLHETQLPIAGVMLPQLIQS